MIYDDSDSIHFLRAKCSPQNGTNFLVGELVGAKITVEVGQFGAKAKVWGPGFHFMSKGDTIDECEKAMLAEIGKAQSSLALFSIAVAAPASIADACAHFIVHWGTLPPLVRAGYAMGMVETAGAQITQRTKRMDQLGNFPLLPRRMRVESLFHKAASILFDFGLALTAEADSEAEARGIDEDTRYTNKNDMGLVAPMPTQEDLDQALGEIMRKASDEIVKEQDEQVLKATEKT